MLDEGHYVFPGAAKEKEADMADWIALHVELSPALPGAFHRMRRHEAVVFRKHEQEAVRGKQGVGPHRRQIPQPVTRVF